MRADPDLLRQLLQLREDLLGLRALHAVLEANSPLGVSIRACADLITPLARAMRLDSAILRRAYDQIIDGRAFWEQVLLLLQAGAAGKPLAPWVTPVTERLERVTHQLRELVLATVEESPEADAPSGAGSKRARSTPERKL